MVTYDPRQSDRSKLASSGGAVNMLAFVAAHPDVVRTLVAHEPPLVSALPDREAAFAAIHDVRDTYERDGLGPGMAKFLGLIMHSGEVPADWTDRPAPDPAQFGLPTEYGQTGDPDSFAARLREVLDG